MGLFKKIVMLWSKLFEPNNTVSNDEGVQMSNKYNKNKILDEIGNIRLDDATIVALFNEINEGKNSEAAQFVMDCVSCELDILQMKRLANARNLSNKEVLLAYKMSRLMPTKESSCWPNSWADNKPTKFLNIQSGDIKTIHSLLSPDNAYDNIHKAYVKKVDKCCEVKNENFHDDASPERVYHKALSKRSMLDPSKEQLSILANSPQYAALYCINVLNRRHDALELAIMRDRYWWQVYQNWVNAPK